MKFKIKPRENPNKKKYSNNVYDTALKFANEAYKEFGSFIVSVALFGASARKENSAKSDIDILVIVDDVHRPITPELVEAYRIIVEKLVLKINPKLHITTLKFTTFWDHVRKADPIAVNILRDGVALIDTGFFDPVQALLYMGRIRPSDESINIYYYRAQRSLDNSTNNLLKATLDLYWAVIDAAHACLMTYGFVPPSPAHVSDMLDKEFYQKHLTSKKYVTIMLNMYELMKMISYREIKEVTGKQYDHYRKEADDFIAEMKRLIDEKKKGLVK